MPETDDLRERAARLQALAAKARDNGDIEFAERLLLRAMRFLDDIKAIEAAEGHMSQHIAQQQQQPQPPDDKDGEEK